MPFKKIGIYSDGADIADMRKVAVHDYVKGFTTNPSLMKSAGVTDYLSFARDVVKAFPKHSISFEVFGNSFETMKQEARVIASLGENVAVKIPILTPDEKSTAELIHELSEEGIAINVTAITTSQQVQEAVDALTEGKKNIISVFAGRIADTGVDPSAFVRASRKICDTKDGAQLLWASTREVLNIFQAQDLGCDIITVPPSILSKLGNIGKSAKQVSIDTVKNFEADIKTLGFSILDD
ncbi:transaldolase [Sporolactobacillus terrae]|uniref:Transaldolase n=1 Tax=Sporolactobacillus terrae TaxID=269673 RepID=A0A5K7WUH3_9BACL|nr:transaldolase [Sporolactobacillus terrae]BBN97962.1 transaldolase [Sporolactobacillus terrae]